MKLIRTGLIFIFFGLYFASCGNHPSDEKNLSESSEAASVREAYEDWVIENYGEEYTEEIQRLQDKSIQKDLQSHFTGDTDTPVVGIIGGGIAGLYAGLLLQSLDIEFEIFEKTDRVGGRLKTWYSKDYDENNPDTKGLYGEIGGMRIPQFSRDMIPVQHLTLAVNSVLERNNMSNQAVNWRKFYFNSPVQRRRFNNMPYPIEAKDGALNDLNFGENSGGDLKQVWVTPAVSEEGEPYLPASKILDVVIGQFVSHLQSSFETGFEKLMEYDNYSMQSYLMNKFTLGDLGEYYDPEMGAKTDHLPYEVYSYLETTNAGTGMFATSFTEMVMAQYDWGGSTNPYDKEDRNIYMITVDKGMQHLSDACKAVINLDKGVQREDGQVAQMQVGMIPDSNGQIGYAPINLLADAQAPPTVPKSNVITKSFGEASVAKERLHLNHKVIHAEHDPSLYNGYGGIRLNVEQSDKEGRNPKTIKKEYPFVITTLPMGAYTNGVFKKDFFDQLSFSKAKAIRELNYMPSFKAMIRFNHQFWQELGNRNDAGLGVSVSDHPSRQIVYPSYGYDSKEGILQIYCWAQDAERMGLLSDEEAVNECLKGIQYLYPEIDIYQYFDGYQPEVTTKTWFWDEHAGGGAFALYLPGQFKNMYPDLLLPEFDGSLYFAGECASVHHGWVVGAMNSAYNSVYNILRQVGADDKIKILEDTWGSLSRPDIADN